MDVLVFGGTRLMGRHLVQALLDGGHRVAIATRGLAPDPFGDRVARLVLDRHDDASLQKNLPRKTYDVVFDDLAYCSNDITALFAAVRCKRYVQVSSASVYPVCHMDLREEEFDPWRAPLVACGRDDFPYGEAKRQAESAIVQQHGGVPAAMARFPMVVGTDDYTKRLYFYVEHIVRQKPMFVESPEGLLPFVRSDEAGRFLAFLGESGFTGPINGAGRGAACAAQIMDYVTSRTGLAPVLSPDGDPAPYNGAEDHSLNTDRAAALGFSFTPLEAWMGALLDDYIRQAQG